MCIRNDAGEFVLAKTDWFAPLCDALMWGEVVGLYTARQWVLDLQFDNVDFVLDSKTVVDHVNFDVDDNSEYGCIISICRRLLQNSFQNYNVEFNRRQVNGIAHKLTQIVPLNHSSYIIDDAPSCIWHILANEILPKQNQTILAKFEGKIQTRLIILFICLFLFLFV